MRRYNTPHQEGFILPVLLFTVIFIVSMLTIVGSLSLTTYNLATRETSRINAQMAADAGLDKGLNELNIDSDWSGTSSSDAGWTGVGDEIELMNTTNIRTTYETDVLPGATSDRKILAVTARAFSPASSTNPRFVRKYEVDIQAVTSGNSAGAVVSGVGGLVLKNNAKITGGDVVVNGTVSMENNSQIGTQSNPVNVRVAHHSCPQPATAAFPQLCSTGQPITVDNSAKIYGTVHANNQTNGTRMYDPGLIAGQSVTPITLPSYDRSTHPVAVTKNASDNDIRCTNNANKTWPANVKIIGNIDMGNNCTITINGNVWITGNFDTGNSGRINVSDALGASRPVIMVDGSDGFTLGNNGVINPNSSNTGVEMRTFWSHSTSGCSPNCTNLTGVGLANSQNVVTIDLGNNGNAAYSVFLAEWSRASVSNNGALGAISGQSIELGNNAVINFTASVPGSDNLTVTWVKRGYMRVFD